MRLPQVALLWLAEAEEWLARARRGARLRLVRLRQRRPTAGSRKDASSRLARESKKGNLSLNIKVSQQPDPTP
jgi:hypothetical protein